MNFLVLSLIHPLRYTLVRDLLLTCASRVIFSSLPLRRLRFYNQTDKQILDHMLSIDRYDRHNRPAGKRNE